VAETGGGAGDAGAVGEAAPADARSVPEPDYTLPADRVHSHFSRDVEPVLRVRPGAVVEAFTQEASAGQLSPTSTAADIAELDFDPIHPLTGPVYVEGAEPGDVLAVTLHEIELGDWGWTGVVPGFGFLSDRFPEAYLKTFTFAPGDSSAEFAPGVEVALRPFPGVVAVAPDTSAELSTIPPRRNGGNLDDRDIVEGATVYLPVEVEGALFSIGDAHAAQGDGEVSGTAIEAPVRVVYELNLVEDGRSLASPEYETDQIYAVTGLATTLDEAARRATLHMIDFLVAEHGMSREDAYALCSLAANLKVAEVVDVPNMMVTMQIPKRVLPGAGEGRGGG
jgi:acetamidase/formamidase